MMVGDAEEKGLLCDAADEEDQCEALRMARPTRPNSQMALEAHTRVGSEKALKRPGRLRAERIEGRLAFVARSAHLRCCRSHHLRQDDTGLRASRGTDGPRASPWTTECMPAGVSGDRCPAGVSLDQIQACGRLRGPMARGRLLGPLGDRPAGVSGDLRPDRRLLGLILCVRNYGALVRGWTRVCSSAHRRRLGRFRADTGLP
jgi:hypothetical protein